MLYILGQHWSSYCRGTDGQLDDGSQRLTSLSASFAAFCRSRGETVMEVLRGTGALLQCLVLAVSITLFPTGFGCSLCNMKLESRDFGVNLWWDCPTLPPNTSFTVRTKTQGEHNWSSKTGCVRVTSRNCNLSEAFQHLALYNMVQLGIEVTPRSLCWSKVLKVDLDSDMVFSPPSVSVSLNHSVLTVKVQFPESRNRRLCPQQTSCPVSAVLQPLTTIMVYNRKQPSKCQIRTLRATNETLNCSFEKLEAGEEYCAMANFTSSSPSSVYCLYMPLEWLVLKPLMIVMGVCCSLLVIIAVILYRQRVPPKHHRLPWTLASSSNTHTHTHTSESLQDEGAREQWVVQEDYEGDHLSILSLSLSSSASIAPEVYTEQHSLENCYHSNPFLLDSDSGQTDLASRGTTDLTGPGYEANPVHWLLEHIGTQSQQSYEISPPTEHDCGLPVRARSPLRPWDVPLDSVKFATAEAGMLEEWSQLSGLVGQPGVAQL
ncbi:hypothetical protein GN956_G800 [Arapaima gigas]